MMMVLNPNAGGGAALLKWRDIQPEVRRRCGGFDLEVLQTSRPLGSLVSAWFHAGETRFVAAGGDGTLNALAQALMTFIPAQARSCIAIGAIGLGSSNDFHKPASRDRCIGGIPCAINFASAAPRDVGVATIRINGEECRHFFLINASAGLSAQANRFFNAPDAVLRQLKRHWTEGAILYAALTTILRYTNVCVNVSVDGGGFHPAVLTNFTVLKSPHVSGGLKFPGVPAYDSGLFLVHLLPDTGRFGRLRFFRGLTLGRLPASAASGLRTASTATLVAEAAFPVEFDGEVVETTEMTFSLLPRELRVCRC